MNRIIKIPKHLQEAPKCYFEHEHLYIFTDPQNQTNAYFKLNGKAVFLQYEYYFIPKFSAIFS